MFKANRGVVPVKFTLTLNGASTCGLPPAIISVYRISGTTMTPVNQTDFIMAADSGTSFRIESASCQYIYNLDSRSMGPGSYEVLISFGDLVVGSARFGLQ
jgi:hypothetical protein